VDHCTVYRTDGFLEAASVKSLVPGLSASTLKRAVAALLEVGSWVEAKGGYLVHGYLEHNLSKEQAEAALASGRRRYHRWKDGRNGVSADEPNAEANALATPRLLGHQSVSLRIKDKVKDVDSAVGGTARASAPGDPGSESAPGELEGEHPSSGHDAGTRPAVHIGSLVNGALPRPPIGRYGEILRRVQAERPEQTPDEHGALALAELDRELKGAPR